MPQSFELAYFVQQLTYHYTHTIIHIQLYTYHYALCKNLSKSNALYISYYVDHYDDRTKRRY